MMCLGIPGLLTELDAVDGQYAWVDVAGAKRRVNIALLSEDVPAPGEWVLIHVGFALARIDEEEAQATLRMLEGMAGAYTDELSVMAQSASRTGSSAPEPVVSVTGPTLPLDGRYTTEGE